MLWDIFCRVIDNHGDIGVCWRLAAQLARRGERVRLRVDDASALAWMAPLGEPGVEVLPWSSHPGPGDVVVEAFGCELPQAFQALMAAQPRPPAWVNLEYLTAESFAERSHGLPSPVMAGAGAGLVKRFFYPGFTPRTGGLLREPGLVAAPAATNAVRRVSMFCYEPAAMPALITQLAASDEPTELLVTAGRATAAVRAVLGTSQRQGQLSVTYLPLMPQPGFDALLASCDVNFVRGEDSLVRALWAGQPFVWQLYPQHDAAHHAKLEAFLDWLDAPPAWRDFQRAWNGVTPALPVFEPRAWADTALAARQRLLAQEDLVTQLLRFVRQPANTSSAGS
ncbi:elongation factor P maturation arginine rhamnosyltransferase EarP [Ramlibacter sp. PS4R-6]|uniref:elongation factor P maturation arginine rhamnosyltransferase EarP n=1 Tax=Ramlibacter sp. PS4R-6 TaxID=3133438 RepID=UPI00309B2BA6